jgi:hypothetical protein
MFFDSRERLRPSKSFRISIKKSRLMGGLMKKGKISVENVGWMVREIRNLSVGKTTPSTLKQIFKNTPEELLE